MKKYCVDDLTEEQLDQIEAKALNKLYQSPLADFIFPEDKIPAEPAPTNCAIEYFTSKKEALTYVNTCIFDMVTRPYNNKKRSIRIKAEDMAFSLQFESYPKFTEILEREYPDAKVYYVSSLDAFVAPLSGGIIVGLKELSKYAAHHEKKISRYTSEGYDYVIWKGRTRVTRVETADQLKYELDNRIRDGRSKKKKPDQSNIEWTAVNNPGLNQTK